MLKEFLDAEIQIYEVDMVDIIMTSDVEIVEPDDDWWD